MGEIARLGLFLAIMCGVSGGLLSFVRAFTAPRIEHHAIERVKSPSVRSIMKNVSNDPVADRFNIRMNRENLTFFVGVRDGRPKEIAFETFGQGLRDKIGIMVGVDLDTDKVVGIEITENSEDAGKGARASTDEKFKGGFKNRSIIEPFKVRQDNGQIDALTGATISSKGICAGLTAGGELYRKLKPEIVRKANETTKKG